MKNDVGEVVPLRVDDDKIPTLASCFFRPSTLPQRSVVARSERPRAEQSRARRGAVLFFLSSTSDVLRKKCLQCENWKEE